VKFYFPEGLADDSPLPIITTRVFLGVYPNFYREFGVNGYLGLAPLMDSYQQFSFASRVHAMLTQAAFFGINFNITRGRNRLGVY